MYVFTMTCNSYELAATLGTVLVGKIDGTCRVGCIRFGRLWRMRPDTRSNVRGGPDGDRNQAQFEPLNSAVGCA